MQNFDKFVDKNIKIVKRKNFLFIIVLLIFALIYSFMLYDLNKSKHQETSFFNISQKLIDSIYQNLNLTEKISYLILADSIKFLSDTNTYLSVSYDIKNNNIKHQFSDGLLYKQLNFPDFNALMSVNDTLFYQYINFAVKQLESNQIRFVITDFFKNLDDDTILQEFYSRRFSYIRKLFYENKILIIPYFKEFKIKNNILYKFYIKNFSTLPILFVKNKKSLKFLTDSLNYSNLIVAKVDSSFNCIDFLRSDINFLSTKKPSKIINQIKNILLVNKNLEYYLERKTKRAIAVKLWLNQKKEKANKPEVEKILPEKLRLQLYYSSIILLKNDTNNIPIKNLNKPVIVYIYTKNKMLEIKKEISFYTKATIKNLKKHKLLKTANYILLFTINQSLSDSDTVILNQIKKLEHKNQVVIINFGHIENLKFIKKFKTIIQTWSDGLIYQKGAIDGIFGGIKLEGKLPIKNYFAFHSGINTSKIRIRPGIPIEANLDAKKLSKIDSIVKDAIKRYIFPGAQIFIVKDGIVVWDKAYGYFTYQHKHKVKTTDLYDLASMTKILATTLATMKLYDLNKIKLDEPIKKYFKNTKIHYKKIKEDTIITIDTINLNKLTEKELQFAIKDKDTIHLNDTLIVSYDTTIYRRIPKRNIFSVTPRELLMHQSGIQPAMPILKFLKYKDYYWQLVKWNAIDSAEITEKNFFRILYSDKYIKDSAEIEIAKQMYLNNRFFDTLYEDTKALLISSKKKYVYSDVNMILLKWTLDTILGYNSIHFLRKNFYKPLGLQTLGYKPLKRFNKYRIAPTENDKYWRHQILQGYVHDPSAALLGGIAGNAGLFSNAKDIAIIAQMLLNSGKYGGKQYIKTKTVELFTQKQKDSFRGLGFDMWRSNYIVARSASPKTYGHLGFTGTCLWIDPQNKIIYVFLSNRIYPSAKNFKINRYKIRQKIHQIIYEAIIK